jgi:hypothetical protein
MNKKHWAVAAATALFLAGCGKQTPPPSPTPATTETAPITQLQKIDIVKGTGEGISAGQQAVVHYTGWIYDPSAPDHKGKQFDSSRERGKPFRRRGWCDQRLGRGRARHAARRAASAGDPARSGLRSDRRGQRCDSAERDAHVRYRIAGDRTSAVRSGWRLAVTG